MKEIRVYMAKRRNVRAKTLLQTTFHIPGMSLHLKKLPIYNRHTSFVSFIQLKSITDAWTDTSAEVVALGGDDVLPGTRRRYPGTNTWVYAEAVALYDDDVLPGTRRRYPGTNTWAYAESVALYDDVLPGT
jgi:hypothetical protein